MVLACYCVYYLYPFLRESNYPNIPGISFITASLKCNKEKPFTVCSSKVQQPSTKSSREKLYRYTHMHTYIKQGNPFRAAPAVHRVHPNLGSNPC